MNDIIKVEDGNAVMSMEFMTHMLSVKDQLKMLKEVDEADNEMLLEAMEKNGIIKVENEHVLVNYIAPTDCETFNTKKFKEENPDIYDSYVKLSKVKPSIRITVK